MYFFSLDPGNGSEDTPGNKTPSGVTLNFQGSMPKADNTMLTARGWNPPDK